MLFKRFYVHNKNDRIAFLMIFAGLWKNAKNKFGKRFIDIGLEKSAVAAASVVEGPSRCSNKGGGKKRWCL